jgi:drug/metabolite transporter superfamily protein YnfA
MMRILARALLVTLALIPAAAFAQQPAASEAARLAQEFSFDKAKAAPAAVAAPLQSEDENKRFHDYRMQQQKDKLWFAVVLGTIAVAAHLIVLVFLYKQAPGHIVGATGLVYIVFGTILLVVIANTEAQLTAAIGVLGAIAGYLFGRLQERSQEGQSAANGAPAPGR